MTKFVLVASALTLAASSGYGSPTRQGLHHAHGFSWLCDSAGCPPGDVPKSLRRRPLHLPQLMPGASCPVSTAHSVSPRYGLALGEGPVYPVGLGANATLTFRPFPHSRWGGQKVLWVVDPSYAGPFLIRGHQLGGRWWVGFEYFPLAELPVPSDREMGMRKPDWRDMPTYTRLRAPGCYAYQIDGASFSTVVVFRATGSAR